MPIYTGMTSVPAMPQRGTCSGGVRCAQGSVCSSSPAAYIRILPEKFHLRGLKRTLEEGARMARSVYNDTKIIFTTSSTNIWHS